MSSHMEENSYGIYVIFTRDTIPESTLVDKLLNTANDQSDVLYCRGCYNGDETQTTRYIACLRKSLYSHLIENCNFKRGEDYNITKYRVNNDPLTNGMTYGFFIRCQENEEQHIRHIFQRFEEHGYLKENSYRINTPTPYPNGNPRGYIIVSFEKNGDRYPRQYIRKLKALLNNSIFEGRRIHVNWVSNSVLRDVLSSENKERKTK